MGTVLEDVTSETVDAAHIARRVEDWARRVRSVYAMIGGWLPDGWQVREGKPVFMHEELMRKFGVGPREMPTLILAGPEDSTARLEPRGLWIIGGNGRIDMKRDGQRYLIVDMAENFALPNWQAASAKKRCDREAFTQNWLRRVLR